MDKKRELPPELIQPFIHQSGLLLVELAKVVPGKSIIGIDRFKQMKTFVCDPDIHKPAVAGIFGARNQFFFDQLIYNTGGIG